MDRINRRRRLPYAINGQIDAAMMAKTQADRHVRGIAVAMKSLVENGKPDAGELLQINRALMYLLDLGQEVSQIGRALDEIRTTQQFGRDEKAGRDGEGISN